MKNEEMYVEEIMDIVPCSRLAVLRKTHKPCGCYQIACSDCLFGEILDKDCFEEARKWLKSEYEPYVDWSKVKVDTKILVSDNNVNWDKRHFCKYENGKVYAWCQGRTSWSAKDYVDVVQWSYAKLYEENENGKN